MKKAGSKTSASATLAKLFAEPSMIRICELLVTLSDDELRLFFRAFYDGLMTLGREVSKSALGLGDPEKTIKEGGRDAPPIVKELGKRISGMVDNG